MRFCAPSLPMRAVPYGSYQVYESAKPGWVPSAPASGYCDIEVSAEEGYSCEFGNCPCLDGNASDLPSCLSAWYPFDECDLDIAHDIAAGNHGTLSGSPLPSWIPDHTGTTPACALTFSDNENGPHYWSGINRTPIRGGISIKWSKVMRIPSSSTSIDWLKALR